MTRSFRWVLVLVIATGCMLLGGCAPKTHLNEVPPPPPAGHGCIDHGGKTDAAAQPAPPSADPQQPSTSPSK